jgi:hypothetical protein
MLLLWGEERRRRTLELDATQRGERGGRERGKREREEEAKCKNARGG